MKGELLTTIHSGGVLLSLLLLLIAISLLWLIPRRNIYHLYAGLHGLRSFKSGDWHLPVVILTVFIFAFLIVKIDNTRSISNNSNQQSTILSVVSYDQPDSLLEKNYDENRNVKYSATLNQGIYEKLIRFVALGLLGLFLLLCLHCDFNRRIGLWGLAAMRREGQCFLRSSNTSYVILDRSGRILEINNKGCLQYGIPRASTIGLPFSILWKGRGQTKLFSKIKSSLNGQWGMVSLDSLERNGKVSKHILSFLPIVNTNGGIGHVVVSDYGILKQTNG